MLRHGVHNLQDPEQTIFFKNSNEALAALLKGQIDVGCAATATLENYVDPSTNQSLDLLSQIRILNPQYPRVSSSSSSSADEFRRFPFAISSDVVPGYQFMAFPHVEQSVQIRVQKELIAMRDHADVAPALLSCLIENNNTECHDNNTDCVNTCFQSLTRTTIRNCDTTPQLAIKAFDALTASGLVGFAKPQGNLRLRDIQEKTGFLIKEPSPRCVRMKNIVDAVTCPRGYFARSSQEIIQHCNVSDLPCYEKDCICSPCVKAFEVDFFTFSPGVSQSVLVGSGCSKFSICGTVEQEHVLSFRAIDNKGRPNATMTGAILRGDESEEPFTFQYVNGTFLYEFLATRRTVGQWIVKIRINGEEIPESPFRINVVQRDCAAETGDQRREPDELGQCICERGAVELSGNCTPWWVILVPSVVGLLLALCLIIWYCHRLGQKKRRMNEDSMWMVSKDEISFATPPQVLGRGAFGCVLLGEFRGTQVAVKRVIPPPGLSTIGNDAECGTRSMEPLPTSSGSGGVRLSSTPAESTAPHRDGVTELAARMSAAGFMHRSKGGADLLSRFVQLKEDIIAEIKGKVFGGLVLIAPHYLHCLWLLSNILVVAFTAVAATDFRRLSAFL
jgi:hypothetical protein